MRTRLPERRFSTQCKVQFPTQKQGEAFKKIVTVGFDDKGRAKEVFCADFKAGTDRQTIVMDACILISRLLQYGDVPQDMLAALCEPPSLVGAIVRAVIEEQEAVINDHKSDG